MASEYPVEAPILPVVPPSIPWRKLLVGGTAVVTGAAASNVLSFLFSFSIARLLKPEDYATVTACLSLMVVATIPGATLQLIAARFTAIWSRNSPSRAHALSVWMVRAGLLLGLSFGIGVAALSSSLSAYLHVPNVLPLLVVAAALLVSFVAPAYRGRLQGMHRFGQFSLASTSEFAVRLIAGVLLVALGASAAGALGGVLLGGVASASLGWWFLRKSGARAKASNVPWNDVLKWAIPAFVVQGSLNILLFQDTLLAKHFFTPADAGSYAGVATTARVLVYASTALASFLFPVVARGHGDGEHGHARLVSHAVLGLVVFVNVVLLIACYVQPELVLRLVVGSQYEAFGGLLGPLALALSAYAVLSVLISYLLATATRLFWIPLLAAPVVETVLIALHHQTLLDFIHSIDIVMLVTLAVVAYIYCLPTRRTHSLIEDWEE